MTMTHPTTDTRSLDSVLRAALDAKKSWPHVRLCDRQYVILKFIDALRAEADDLAIALSEEIGTPITAARAEVAEAIQYVTDTIGASNAFYGTVYPHGAESITASFLQYTVNEPLGVVAVVMDELEPVLSFAYQVASTVLTGNVVVLVPGPRARRAVTRLVELLHQVGLPRDALQCLEAEAHLRDALIASPLINGLNVHGTTDQVVAATVAARRNLTRVVALGSSNDAVVILDDADLDLAVAEVVRAAFDDAGQRRNATKRVLVQESVAAEFTDKLVEAVGQLTVGDPSDESTEVGPLVSADAAADVRTQIEKAVAEGAEVLIGGRVTDAYVTPTVLRTGAGSDLAVSEVIHGPVVAVVSVEGDEEAVDLVNASPYAFGAGVFTRDVQRAGAVADGVVATVVVVNGAGDYRSRQMPFGGQGRSGVGTESIIDTPLATTELKTLLAADIYEFVAENEDNPVGRHT